MSAEGNRLRQELFFARMAAFPKSITGPSERMRIAMLNLTQVRRELERVKKVIAALEGAS